jgi:hypothetical protein
VGGKIFIIEDSAQSHFAFSNQLFDHKDLPG